VKSAPDIVFTTSSPIFSNQEAFLANEKNKKAFVDLLITKLRSHGLTVRQANDDADTVAVSVTIELASNGTDVTVVASDTDIFVLLLYHFRPVMAAIVILTVGAKHRVKYRCIRTVCSAIGTTALQQILVIDAISGCDTPILRLCSDQAYPLYSRR